MRDLYEKFPYIVTGEMIIRQLSEEDADALFPVFGNDNMFRYIPDYLHAENKEVLRDAIRCMNSRDFQERRWIVSGIFLQERPEEAIGTVELFAYSKDVNVVEIGYRVNERLWGRGIATKAVQAMTDYLFENVGINRIQATVMPENTKSKRVLEKNGFQREGLLRQAGFWQGKGIVDLEMYSRLRSDTFFN